VSSEGRIVLETRAVTKCYHLEDVEVNALRGVDVAIRQGEMVSIMGPSGSGKSTLMHILGLLDRPSAGEVVLEGRDVSRLAPNDLAALRNRYIGFVFQAFNLLPQISAFENVEMPLVFGGVPPRERKARVTEVLTRVGLADRMEHKPTELSGGQMQRVAIARALSMDPDVLLADEPTGNLDTHSGTDIMAVFLELAAQGRTLVVITHDMALARRAHRIVEIRDGRIVADRPAAEAA